MRHIFTVGESYSPPLLTLAQEARARRIKAAKSHSIAFAKLALRHSSWAITAVALWAAWQSHKRSEAHFAQAAWATKKAQYLTSWNVDLENELVALRAMTPSKRDAALSRAEAKMRLSVSTLP